MRETTMTAIAIGCIALLIAVAIISDAYIKTHKPTCDTSLNERVDPELKLQFEKQYQGKVVK